jgi:DNA polymerase-3 subunit epsilon
VNATQQYANDGLELRPSGGLVERAIAALRAGPLHTTALARIVMGIQGAPPAAAAAVFTLLGTDARFAVDRDGVWTLLDVTPETGRAGLGDEDWVVVDVETTGGSPRHGHRVTEIAAVCVSGGAVRQTFSTLVNPERRIPSMITALTGITDEMVREAPRFQDVAADLAGVLRGRVFVAHNAAFDWKFVSAEVGRATGERIEGRRLCTVRLARKLLPQLPRRSLDHVARYYGVEIGSRHRAGGDALATAQVLLRLLRDAADRGCATWPELESLLATPSAAHRRGGRRRRSAMPRPVDRDPTT